MRHGLLVIACAVLAGALLLARATPLLPNVVDSVKMVVIGDNGTGSREQAEVAEQMASFREQFRYDLVLMVGDNFYGPQRPSDLEQKFARPYRPLLDAGVTFQAALGNHDNESSTINYSPLNMNGRRYYSFVRPGVRFIVLDTNVLDAAQLQWADAVLQQAREPWRIAYFHHPLYGNARRHGANADLRVLLEPLLLEHGVQVVFSGHDHVYERLKPQKGIHYFVTGSAGQLRKGSLDVSNSTAAGFDEDLAFLAAEIAGENLHFQVVLHDVSFEIPRGSMRILLGNSGAGKSVVLKLIQIRDAFCIATHEAVEPDGKVTIVGAGDHKAGQTEFMVLHDGRIQFQGTGIDLLASRDRYLREFLFKTLPPW